MNKSPLLSLLSPLWNWLNRQPWMRPALLMLAALCILTEKLAPPHTLAHQLAKEVQSWLLVLASGSLGLSHPVSTDPSLSLPGALPEPKTDEEAAQVLRDTLKSVLVLALALSLVVPRLALAQEKGVYVVKEARLATTTGEIFDVQGGAYYSSAANLKVAKETIRLQNENALLKAQTAPTSTVLLLLLSVSLAGAAAYGGYRLGAAK